MLYAEDFSQNTPQGACPDCHGLGSIYDVTEAAMAPDSSLSIREGAIAARPTFRSRTQIEQSISERPLPTPSLEIVSWDKLIVI
jgi:excinuclease UvrABC ATPase subunit